MRYVLHQKELIVFGYIIVNKEKLTADQFDAYHSFYCGVCHELREKYGASFSFLLNYDMTFLAMVLSGLRDDQTTIEEKKCPAHFRRKETVRRNEHTAYGADMTLLLSYYKALDDLTDEGRHKRLVKKLKEPFAKVEQAYPETAAAVSEALCRIVACEKDGCEDLDPLCNATGDMLGAIFRGQETLFPDQLYGLGYHLGRFIYLMDAYDDLDDDIKKKRYNPLKKRRDEAFFDERIGQYLETFMAEAVDCFERMPILEYGDIIRNILYSGVWSRFEQKRRKKERKESE